MRNLKNALNAILRHAVNNTSNQIVLRAAVDKIEKALNYSASIINTVFSLMRSLVFITIHIKRVLYNSADYNSS